MIKPINVHFILIVKFIVFLSCQCELISFLFIYLLLFLLLYSTKLSQCVENAQQNICCHLSETIRWCIFFCEKYQMR